MPLLSKPNYLTFLLSLAVMVVLAACSNTPVLPDVHQPDASHGDEYFAKLAQDYPPFDPAEAITTAATGSPQQVGSWSGVTDWPLVPVSVSQLPDGRLLAWASRQRNSFFDATLTPDFSYAVVWNPATGRFSEVNNTNHDMFCGSQVMLPDGTAFVSGGNHKRQTSLFNAGANSWESQPLLNGRRWYSTAVALPNGQVFSALGGTGNHPQYPELWTQDEGWELLTGINFQTPLIDRYADYADHDWWPHLHLAPNGQVFHSGPTPEMHYFDPSGDGSMTKVGPNLDWYPKYGAAIMYDKGKIIVTGGASSSASKVASGSARTMLIDINSGTPRVTRSDGMNFGRKFHNGVVLPNGEVLVVGGNTSGIEFSDAGSVLAAEVWNPATGKWRELANASVPRNYHSVAVLLQDGRVWSAGGGLCSGCATNHPDAQIYSPPYLFNSSGGSAQRPSITSSPLGVSYGQEFTVEASNDVSRFTMVKMSSTTHGVNTDLRFLNVPSTRLSGSRFRLTAEANENVLSPGYWMLFALNDAGTPSVAEVIHVRPGASLVSPGAQVSDFEETVGLQIEANNPVGSTLTYGTSGLPDGLSINSSSGVISGTPTVAGSFNVTVTLSGGGNSDRVSFSWTVNSAPVPPLDVDPVSSSPRVVNTNAGYSASFSGGVNPRFKWQFGDGSPETAYSSSAQTTHRYSQPGRYVVTLTATDDTEVEIKQSFSQLVHEDLSVGRSRTSSSIAVDDAGRVWNVNPDNNSVSVFNSSGNKLAEIEVGTGPRSLALAGGSVWVTNKFADSLSVIDASSLSLSRTLTLPYGSQPYGAVASKNGDAVFVVLETGGHVLKFNASSGAQTASLDIGLGARHVSLDGGDNTLLVTRYITPLVPGENSTTVNVAQGGAEVLIINPSSLSLVSTALLRHSDRQDSESAGRGIPNYLGAAVISPAGTSAWIPSKQDNIARGEARDGLNLSFEHTVRSVASKLDLGASASEDLTARVDFDNGGTASAAVYGPYGAHLFVALEGSRQVAVVNTYTHAELFRFEVGRAPQGLALSADGETLFVHNFMDRSVGIYDISDVNSGGDTVTELSILDTVASERLSNQVLTGKQLFYDAADNRLAKDDYMSCASCHNDGGHDGRVWDMTGYGEGLRNTISLRGRAGMANGRLHWSGNFDEVQDFEGQIRDLSGGEGLMSDADFNTRRDPLGDSKTGVSSDLDALAAYVTSLDSYDASPYRSDSGELTAQAEAGKQVFRQAQCADCHGGAAFSSSTNDSSNTLYNIGTLENSSGLRLNEPLTGIDTPSLKNLWDSAPYLHNGSAATLRDAVKAHRNISFSEDDVDQLVAYLTQLDARAEAVTPLDPGAATLAATPGANGNTDAAVAARNVQALAFSLSADRAVNLETLLISADGSGDDALDLTSVKLWQDSDNDGKLSAADVQLDSGTFSDDNGSLALATTGVTVDGPVAFIVTVDVNSALAGKLGSSLAILMGLSVLGLAARRRRKPLLALSLIVLLAACGNPPPNPVTNPGTPGDPNLPGTNSVAFQLSVVGAQGSEGGKDINIEGLPIKGTVITVRR